MNRTLPAAVLSVVVLVGCGTPSEVDRDAAVQVRGTVVHQDGSPVGDPDVVLVKEIGVDEFLSGATTVMTSWGFACLHSDVDPCGEYAHHTVGDGDGGFTFELRGSDVQSGFGTASTMTVSAAAPAAGDQRSGAATSLSFLVQRESLDLPTLHLWEPELTIASDADHLSVAWPSLPEGYPADATYEAVVVDEQGQPIWTLSTSGERLDSRALEDLRGGVAVQAGAEGTVGDRRADVVFRSAQHPVVGPGAPPSRGASCSATDGRLTQAVIPCPLTDGDLVTLADVDVDCAEQATPTNCPEQDTALVIDLGTERPLGTLVLRGDADDLVVDVSIDGRSWNEVLTVEMTATHAVVPLPRDTAGRMVRLRGTTGDIGQFREVSVW